MQLPLDSTSCSSVALPARPNFWYTRCLVVNDAVLGEVQKNPHIHESLNYGSYSVIKDNVSSD